MPIRAPAVLDSSYMTDLLLECGLSKLEKLLLLLPGVNDTPAVFKLDSGFLEFLLDFCPGMKKVGNLLTWSVTREDCGRLRGDGARYGQHDLDLMYRTMTMH